MTTSLSIPTQNRSAFGRPAILAIHFAVLGALLLGWLVYSLSAIPDEAAIQPLCAILVGVTLWNLWSWKKVTGTLFDPYAMFLVAAFLFNGGQALLELFHANDNGLLNGKFSPSTLVATLFLVTVSLVCFHLGALFAPVRQNGRKLRESARDRQRIEGRLRYVGWTLLLISIVPTVLLMKEAIGLVLSGGYFALYQQDASTGIGAGPEVLAAFLVPASVFLLAGSAGSKSALRVSAAIIAADVLVQLFLGARAAAITPLLAYAWVWDRTVRRLPRGPLLGIGALIVFVLFPIIAFTRNSKGTERSSAKYAVEAIASLDNPAVASLSEIGGTMSVVAHTIELVPSDRDYDEGAGYLYAVSTVFPNLFWDVHPAIQHGTDSAWLIRTIDPLTALRGGGLGFSFIAEAFLSFGWFGPIVIGFIGFLYARLVLSVSQGSDIAKIAMIGSFVASFLVFARAESAVLFRPLLWYSLLPYLAVVGFGVRRRVL